MSEWRECCLLRALWRVFSFFVLSSVQVNFFLEEVVFRLNITFYNYFYLIFIHFLKLSLGIKTKTFEKGKKEILSRTFLSF